MMDPWPGRCSSEAPRSNRGSTAAYAAHIGEEWNCPVVPHGGLVTATTVRAMTAELGDPEQTLRSVTTVFAAQVLPGAVEIDVSVLRRGRSIIAVHGDGPQPGRRRPATASSRCSARERAGFEFTDATPPDRPAAARVPVVPRSAASGVRRLFASAST